MALRRRPSPEGLKKSHTLRNEFLVFLLVLLVCGGCFTVLGGGLGSTDKSRAIHQTAAGHAGGAGDAVNIKEGKPFRIDEMTFHPGWRVSHTSRSTEVTGLRVTNARGKRATSATIDVKLWSADELLGVVHCTSGALERGQTGPVKCSSTDRPVITFTKVTANFMP